MFKLAQPAPPAPPKSDDERRIMSWKSWAVVESCRAVDPELTAEHREASEIEHKEDDELEEVVVVTKKGDFHFEVDVRTRLFQPPCLQAPPTLDA